MKCVLGLPKHCVLGELSLLETKQCSHTLQLVQQDLRGLDLKVLDKKRKALAAGRLKSVTMCGRAGVKEKWEQEAEVRCVSQFMPEDKQPHTVYDNKRFILV